MSAKKCKKYSLFHKIKIAGLLFYFVDLCIAKLYNTIINKIIAEVTMRIGKYKNQLNIYKEFWNLANQADDLANTGN